MRTWLLTCVLLAGSSFAFAACGGDSDGSGPQSGGEGGEDPGKGGTAGRAGGSGGTSASGGTQNQGGTAEPQGGESPGTGGVDGESGSGGEGPLPPSAAGPHAAQSIVTAGTLAKSENFQAVLTLGETPGGNTVMSSASYRANLGLVGSVQ